MDVRAALFGSNGRLSRGAAGETVALQDGGGEGEHVQHGLDLETTANQELAKIPLSEPGVDAFSHTPSPVNGLAVRALHSPAPGGNAGTIVVTGRIGIGVVLATDRRSI